MTMAIPWSILVIRQSTESSLYGFFQNFCAPQQTPISTYRDAITQPYVYWTLQAPFVTIIGLYGNVDGTLDGRGTVAQQQWLATQLKNADPTTCNIVADHPPAYSLDGTQVGIHQSLLRLIKQPLAQVWPHAVFSDMCMTINDLHALHSLEVSNA